jgi:heptosyltransferase-1
LTGLRILAVRLGAMGDVVHTLPAVATLKHSFPHSHLTWAIEPRWAPLLEGNPFIDEVVFVERSSLNRLLGTRRRLRARTFDFAVDFQGLLKSALVAAAARPERIYGFHASVSRERLAAWFYSNHVRPSAAHVVDQNLELAAATGASALLRSFPLPPGIEEGELPRGPFVLASPFAGWGAKQWPLEHYAELGRRLKRECGMPLVLNGPPEAARMLQNVPDTEPHISGVAGLIYATRAASAVAGVDSGPMHIAAAIGKPGVAVIGPTDPARNGPYGCCIRVLRSTTARTSYQRRSETDASMRAITPDVVFEALVAQMTHAVPKSVR